MDLDDIPFKLKAGKNNTHDIALFGLTTCGFCKKAITYLDEHEMNYRYVFMDELPGEQKNKIKKQFMEKFGKRLLYPTAIIDGDELIHGFIRPTWDVTLGIEAG